MGSNGSFLKEGGFNKQEWEQVGTYKGVKIIRKIGLKDGIKGNLPFYSNTPGTAYILLDASGKFSQYRQYGEDRKPVFDIDYGKHGGKITLHKHDYGQIRTKGPTIIASMEDGIINKRLYDLYKGLLKGIKL